MEKKSCNSCFYSIAAEKVVDKKQWCSYFNEPTEMICPHSKVCSHWAPTNESNIPDEIDADDMVVGATEQYLDLYEEVYDDSFDGE